MKHEFNVLESPHIILKFHYRATVSKTTKQLKEEQDKTGTDDDVYYIIMALPTCVMFVVLLVYLFLYANKSTRDLSGIRKPKRSRFGNEGRYNLPVSITDIHKPSNYKRS
ncbi:unnamed protein product [Ambrosiozyma monospora]|uniref:Unnamed protein product n=1 Tax=Ambrosiozyma monospora TaxID=43982 RepID=A0ACB5UA41_AMBMO|nr:unnamed protein product [Ambrosiozyma monospora]